MQQVQGILCSMCPAIVHQVGSPCIQEAHMHDERGIYIFVLVCHAQGGLCSTCFGVMCVVSSVFTHGVLSLIISAMLQMHILLGGAVAAGFCYASIL